MNLNRTEPVIARCLVWARRVFFAAGCCAVLGLAACTPRGDPPPVSDEEAALAQNKRAGEFMRVGNKLRDEGNLENAADMYHRAGRADSKSPLPPAALGDVLRRLGRFQEAEQAFNEALKRNRYSGSALQGYGILMIEKGEPDTAIAALDNAVDEEAADFRVYNVLGIAYDTLGDHAQAQNNYLAGLELAPRSRSLRNNMALSLALQERYEAAIDQMRQFRTGEEADKPFLHNIALIYGLAGRIEEAAQALRDVLPEADVANNLAFYQSLRAMPPDQRRKAVLDTVLSSVFIGSGATESPPKP
jgi:Flp pilus assembly protein TadD